MNLTQKGKFATILVSGILVFSSMMSVPQTAHAADYDSPLQVFNSLVTSVSTAAERTLNYILNGLAWDVANLAIESMTKSTVNWINSGFQGSPAFVTDLRQNMNSVADAVAGRFFNELSATGFGRLPSQDRVLDAVRLAYYLRTSPESFYVKYPYTLNQVSPDDNAFLAGDFSQGGFNAWFATVMVDSNNPYGARELAERYLDDAIAGEVSLRTQELDWGNGFLSWRGECQVMSDDPADLVDLSNEDQCLGYETLTPGSVIENQLNEALGAGRERLIAADSINEIISALLNQLVGQVLGGGGLTGATRPSSGGGSSFVDQSTDYTQNPGNSGSTGAAFAATLSEQKSIIETYQANWQRIRSVAEAAQSRCGANGDTNASEALTMAQEALVKAANAIAAFEDLQTRIDTANATGGNQTQAISGIANDFTLLTRSSTVPSSEEIAAAQIGAQDTGDAEPGSLYSQLQRQASGSCSGSED